jgi:hypothetical protein
MDGANRGTRRADTALSGNLIDLVANDCPLNLFDDPLSFALNNMHPIDFT